MSGTRRALVSLLVVCIVVTAALTSACKPAAVATPTPKPVVKPIKIGMGVALTGQYAYWGTNYAQSGGMAVDEINAAGGVLGRTIELQPLDDQLDPKQAVVVAHSFCTDPEIVAVFGHWSSGTTIAADPVYNECHMPILTNGSNPAITAAGYDNVNQMWPADPVQGTAAAGYLVNQRGVKSVAITHDKGMYGEGVATNFKAECERLGVKVTSFQGLNPADADFTPLLTKIKAEDPDAVYHGGYGEVALIIKQARALDMRQIFVGGDTNLTAEVADAAGDAVIGLIGASGAPPWDTNDKTKAFAEKLSKKAGIPLQDAIQMNQPYEGLYAFAEAIKIAGVAEREAIVKALKQVRWQGLFREVSWDSTGKLRQPYMYLAEWKKDASGQRYLDFVYQWLGEVSQ